MDPEALIRTHIQKARFANKTINELATKEPFDLTEILQQIDVLSANADQSPWDASKAVQLLEFIDERLPDILDPPNPPDEEVEERCDRHSSKMQHGGEPHLDIKALRSIQW